MSWSPDAPTGGCFQLTALTTAAFMAMDKQTGCLEICMHGLQLLGYWQSVCVCYKYCVIDYCGKRWQSGCQYNSIVSSREFHYHPGHNTVLSWAIVSEGCRGFGTCFNIETILPGIGIPLIKIRWSWDCLIFILYKGNSYTGKMTSLYWDPPPVSYTNINLMSTTLKFECSPVLGICLKHTKDG